MGCGASAPAPVGVLLPSFFESRKQTKGHPPPSTGPAQRWLFTPPPFSKNPFKTRGGQHGQITRAKACAIASTENARGRTRLEQPAEHVARVRQHGVPPRALLPRQPVLLLPAQLSAIAGRREGLVRSDRRISGGRTSVRRSLGGTEKCGVLEEFVSWHDLAHGKRGGALSPESAGKNRKTPKRATESPVV